MLVGREGLEGGKIRGGEIGDGEIGSGEDGVGIAGCEKFFFNYINCCAVSLHSANLVVNKVTVEIASTY
jgi:hypothetical protein